MGLRITHVDAFTDTPFAGNPAAVCLLPSARDDGWMLRLALLRAGLRRARRSGDGLGALRARPVLAGTPRQERAGRLPGLAARGIVRVRVAGDRVKLGGKAVTVLRGELL